MFCCWDAWCVLAVGVRFDFGRIDCLVCCWVLMIFGGVVGLLGVYLLIVWLVWLVYFGLLLGFCGMLGFEF